MRLLLVDPDIPFAVSLKQALEGTGEFQVSLAGNGAAGEEIGSQAEFDAVVIGFDPPDMDIMELMRRMRLLQPDKPLILCPETTVQHERARFLVADGSMGKPFTAREFIPYLRRVLQRSKGPEITPPSPGAQDEFIPPQMPSVVREFTRPEPVGPTQSPTDLLDWMERKKFQDEREPQELLGEHPSDQPRAADILEEFEALERARSEQVPSPARPGESDAERQQAEPGLQADRGQTPPHDVPPGMQDLPVTRRLSGEAAPPATRHLGEEDQPADTQRLRDTEQLPPRLEPSETEQPDQEELYATRRLPDDTFDSMITEEGWKVREEPSVPYPEEPPRRHDDTPTVPPHDLAGVRQFLATNQGPYDPYDFGEVLDAIAKSSPSDYDRLAHDPEFHDLVDSMRVPESTRPRRTRLDDLLTSIASDLPEEPPPADSDGALDYVLEAIRRGAASMPSTEEETADQDLGDATIGDVIEGLFDPSFEGVLAALAGKDVTEDTIDEPTYGRAAEAAESLEPQAEDQFKLEDMSADEDQPAWLAAYEVEEIAPPQPPPALLPIEEPPITEEDSSHYPATTALTAVTGAQESDDFSLDRLLKQIEQQLPPPRSLQPHLKPLPSWQKLGQIESGRDMAVLFDRLEGKEPPPAPTYDLVETPDDSVPAEFVEVEESVLPPLLVEPPLVAQDTRPSPSIREALDRVPVQETDTTPVGPVLPEAPEEPESVPVERDHSEAVAALERLFEGEEPPLAADQAGAALEAGPERAETGEIISDEDLFALAQRFAENAAQEWEAGLSPDATEEAGTGEMISAYDLFGPEEGLMDTWEAEEQPEVTEEAAFAEPITPDDLFTLTEQPAEEWEVGELLEAVGRAAYAESAPIPDEFIPEEQIAEEWQPEERPEVAEEAAYGEPVSAPEMFAPEEQIAEPPVEEWEAEEQPEVTEQTAYGEPVPAPEMFAPEEQIAEPPVDEWEAEERPAEEWEPGLSELGEEAGAVETGEMIAEESLFALSERPAGPPAEEWEPGSSELAEETGYAEPFLDEESIAQAFFEGVRSTAEHDAIDLTPVHELDQAAPPEEAVEEEQWQAVTADQEAFESLFRPDDEHLVPVPVEEAVRLLESEPLTEEAERADDEEERLAQAAVLLTQYSLESSAQATMLTRPGKLLAQAGDLPSVAMQRLFQVVDSAWMTSASSSDSLIRFITLPEAGEFLLYSTQVEHDLILSMVFNANTSVRTIRRQARRLSESLDLVPEEPAEEPPAAKTLPSRPTDPRPPAGLREAVAAGPSTAERIAVPDLALEEEAGPYTAYTCLWLPADPGVELLGDFADALHQWILDIADGSAWELHDLDIRPDYLVLSLSVPQKTLPDTAVTHLMDETARRSAKHFPDVVDGAALWADGYYVVAPPRELSDREIARFITYQRQAQLG
jgi:DNA-binding response OmpR family regulator